MEEKRKNILSDIFILIIMAYGLHNLSGVLIHLFWLK